ncbi:MAG: Fic family protein [Acidobacteria bacterium]|nr:MAG: Fic family protein [Acidobacteriota bacterium]
MLFTAPKQLDRKELEVIDKIDELRKSLKYAISTPARWHGVLRRATLARNIRHSNSIEGINVTKDDAMAAVENQEPTDASRGDWQATTGYRDAMTYVLQLASDPHFSYDESLIRSLHFMITQHDLTKHPGRWRPGMIFVRDEKKQTTVYEGPDADLVPSLMHELVQELNESSKMPVKVRAAMAHLNLVMIHPFSDGNGRMARCLQTLVLAREQFIEPPFCSIEEYLGRFTQEYYDVLGDVGRGSWHPENNCKPWIRFNLVAHYRQGMWLMQRIRMTQRVWDELECVLNSNRLPSRAIAALTDAAFGYRVRNSSYSSVAEISEQVGNQDLKALAKAGLLVASGETRGRYYVASPSVKDVYRKHYEPKSYEDPFVQMDLPLIDTTSLS